MAIVTSTVGLNTDEVDFNLLVRFYQTAHFFDNVNVNIGGRTYPDIYEVIWGTDGVTYSSVFGGVDLSVGADHFSGTVTGYLQSYFSVSGWLTPLTYEDISVPANSIYQVSLTPSTVDDAALMRLLSAGNDTFELSEFGDVVRSFGGNDVIRPKGGNDFVDGGDGLDTALLSGLSSRYKLVVGANSITVQDKVGSEGLDTLVSVEQTQFADRVLDTTWFTKAASVPASQFTDLTDMYIAYFDRAPDALGLLYWASRLKDGMTLQEIAKSFFVQPETLAAYPASQTTTEFVTKVYNNMLGRDPDQGGLNYWVNSLESVDGVSKDEFMLAVIYGARASTGSPADVQYLSNKNLVGKDYAVTEGLSNVTWAKTVMANVDGSAGSVQAAFQLTDGFATTAALPISSELVVQLVGVVI